MPKKTIDAKEFFQLKMSTLGERIRFFREKLGELDPKEDYSTRAIGKRIGVTSQSITAIERGESKNPSFQVILGLAKVLHVPIDTFTDDFYQGDIKLFEIGVHDGDQTAITAEYSELDPALSSDFYFGCYVYQVFQDGRMRFVYCKDTKNSVDYKSFIKSLSRFVAEIELHSLENDDILTSTENRFSSFHHAVSLFNACIEHPTMFPLIMKDEWIQYFNEFHEEHFRKEQQKHE
ncbi:Helix-turn-helix domain protein [Paenibacillus konkukensis]|uniref:Helix-turn-helix domain protein n=1 Tax=Paenibacillus konkukensis TaxID=2020716 RepID=A0ABY4RSP3_9BACL|nr:helix-turn-helix transcriptional regulator [Paenibacillus konkukensis]UQZ84553.1 Helix-turn-helix domain protein [Paenibacillus konkukensis]